VYFGGLVKSIKEIEKPMRLGSANFGKKMRKKGKAGT
jgi:hypothetical protein